MLGSSFKESNLCADLEEPYFLECLFGRGSGLKRKGLSDEKLKHTTDTIALMLMGSAQLRYL